MDRKRLVVILLVSLAFNVGFAARLALTWSGSRDASPAASRRECCPGKLHVPDDRLRTELADLRADRADRTGRLAELMTARETDRAAIEACLDRLSQTERTIKGLVIEAVLAHRETLTEEEREQFCGHVHSRLCEPWANCRPATTCPPHEEPQEPSGSGNHADSQANGRQP